MCHSSEGVAGSCQKITQNTGGRICVKTLAGPEGCTTCASDNYGFKVEVSDSHSMFQG